VQESKMVAVQPPCMLPILLQCSGPTVNEKVVVPAGDEEAERSFIWD